MYSKKVGVLILKNEVGIAADQFEKWSLNYYIKIPKP